MDKQMRIGYIGLGLMGKPMARNILRAGYETVVYNRSRGKTLELVSEGAKEGFSPADVAGQVDMVFTNLPDSPDVLQVVTGEQGILEGAQAGLIVIDNSTIKPATTREIYELCKAQEVAFLDAPVSGGDIGAKNGTLAIMVGGEAEALEKALPVLNVLGKKITHVGEAGAGQIAKAANQIMVAAQMVAMGELLIFAKKSGADPKKVIEAIKGGAAQCWTLDIKPQRLFEGNRTPGFKAAMQAKDLAIVMETAKAYGIACPGAAISAQLFNAMLANGMSELDNSAVIAMIEQLSGVGLLDD